MEIALTAPRSELGRALTSVLQGIHPRPGGPRVLINVALQPPNNLLHDGRAWKRFPPPRVLSLTRGALREARNADFLVHASYLFLRAAESVDDPGDRLRPIVDAGLVAEEMVLQDAVPSCVVRLGFVYGPESTDLKAYRRAFRIGRPYWAGPPESLQHHLHSRDAARALLAAARQRAAGTVVSAYDDVPASFTQFMDHFARLVGNPLPLHIFEIARPVAHLIVAEEHMQMVELSSAAAPPGPRPRGFAPLYPDYRAGLRQVVDAWAR